MGLQGVLEWRVKEKLSDAKEHQLFLIIQEAMANIVKHAGAQTALLTVAETERQIVMTLAGRRRRLPGGPGEDAGPTACLRCGSGPASSAAMRRSSASRGAEQESGSRCRTT